MENSCLRRLGCAAGDSSAHSRRRCQVSWRFSRAATSEGMTQTAPAGLSCTNALRRGTSAIDPTGSGGVSALPSRAAACVITCAKAQRSARWQSARPFTEVSSFPAPCPKASQRRENSHSEGTKEQGDANSPHALGRRDRRARAARVALRLPEHRRSEGNLRSGGHRPQRLRRSARTTSRRRPIVHVQFYAEETQPFWVIFARVVVLRGLISWRTRMLLIPREPS